MERVCHLSPRIIIIIVPYPWIHFDFIIIMFECAVKKYIQNDIKYRIVKQMQNQQMTTGSIAFIYFPFVYGLCFE